jgi:hypothetical protein
MENYTWKMKGLAYGVDPSVAAMELLRLQTVYGVITPDKIVKEASNKNSLLHPIFEWDDSKAGHNYRLQQARTLLNNIEVTIISDGEPVKISNYEVTSIKDGYKSIDSFTPADFDYVKNSILRELSYLKGKLKTYKEFEKASFHIQAAIESIN